MEHLDIAKLSNEHKSMGSSSGFIGQVILDFLPDLVEGEILPDDVEKEVIDFVLSYGVNGTVQSVGQGIVKGAALLRVTLIINPLRDASWHREY